MNTQEINEQKKSYTGTKIINAFPMNRADYNVLRGWELPADENGADEGYLVEYPDSDSNVDGFEGYISWSPKDVFERSYFENTEPKPNTVKIEAIEDQIVNETYTVLPSGKVTVCELILRNGYSVTGTAAVVDIRNFDLEIGKQISRERAISSLYPTFAYLLSEELTARGELSPGNFYDPYEPIL